MRKVFTVLFLFLFTLSAPFAHALEEEQINDIKKKLNTYVKALKSKSQRKTEKAFLKLWKDSVAMEYIKTNHPKYHYSLRMFELSVRAQQVAFDVDEAEDVPGRETDRVISDRSSEGLTNSQRAKRFPIQDERTNQDVVKSSSNQTLPDNKAVADATRNQDQLSNQDLIKNRLKSRLNR